MKNEEENRIERLEHLIQSKAFHELSADERDFVLEEFESEEQYTSMQKLSPVLDGMAVADDKFLPRPSTLDFLKTNLSAGNSSGLVWKWFEVKMPAYAVALITIIACAITWWLTDRPVEQISARTANRIDTVYLTSKADTVFKNKIIYRFVKTTVEAKLPSESKNDPVVEKREPPVGVSMKDKEELERLLVSGSR